jgi:hypothetical protein
MKGKRVACKQTGEQGTVTKVIGKCLWVAMDDGRELSGAKQYFKVLKVKA